MKLRRPPDNNKKRSKWTDFGRESWRHFRHPNTGHLFAVVRQGRRFFVLLWACDAIFNLGEIERGDFHAARVRLENFYFYILNDSPTARAKREGA